MEEKRKIIINPELFKFNTSGGTRKKKEGANGAPKIKMKKPVSMDNKNKKSIKNKILRYIREQQEEKYKSLFEENLSKHTQKKNIEPILNELDTISAIEDTIQHFDALEKQLKTKEEINKQKPNVHNAHNHTLKNNIISDSNLYNTYMGIPTGVTPPIIQLPNVADQIQYANINPNTNMRYTPGKHPGYGCLKNGKLPTFKTLMNKTQKNYSSMSQPNISIVNPKPNLTPSVSHNVQSSHIPIIQQPIQTMGLPSSPLITTTNINEELLNREKLKRISELKQMQEMIQKSNQKAPETLKYMKRKKTLKRTFFVGKSKVHPKIGVLIPNKTIRKTILTKSHLLKQTPITDMKKYLIKRGFIKVGSSAPKDVIAKMYESAMLIGGEIQNHNPENLLYNYFHSE
jgi:hypothetical protein